MLLRAWILTILVLGCSPLHADERKEVEKRLQGKYLEQAFVIRNFYGGDHLVFDSHGNLVNGDRTIGHNGSWAAAAIQIEKLELKKDKLVLRGPRVLECYSSQGWAPQRLRHNPKIEIEVGLDVGQMNEAAVADLLDNVFLKGTDDMISLIPDAWRAEGFQPAAKHFFKTGEGTAAPKGINTPAPEYSEAASAAKLQGMVVLWLAIDEHGTPMEIKVLRCLGLGLDEKSVEALKTWKFEPARKDGQPVPVSFIVTMEFHQY